MKKAFAFLLVLLCCISAAVPATALVPANIGSRNSNIFTEGINNIAEDQAAMLKELGLFLGTDKGFELHRGLTRAEAGVLLTRVLGGESEALSHANTHPFTDVPAWADKYIGWLYQNKITNGVSASLYGSAQPVTYWQFATFLSRACSGNDNFIDNGVGRELEQDYCDGGNSTAVGFARRDAAGLLTRFLGVQYSMDVNDEYITVAQHLADRGVFTKEQLYMAGEGIYPIYYYCFDEDRSLTSTMLGVRMARSSLAGIDGSGAYPPTELPYFYAWKFNDDGTVLYKIDCLTLENAEVARFEAADPDMPRIIEHYATVGGKDYLGVTINGSASLVRVDGETPETVAQGGEFGVSFLKYDKPIISNDNRLAIMLDDMVYIATEDGFGGHRLEAGSELVAVRDGVAVLYREENGGAVIEGVNIADWTVTDTYSVALPETEYYPPLIREYAEGIYGEAGLFIIRGGRLIRATERPVLDVSGVRYGAAGMPVILTHGLESYTGYMIIVLNDPYYTGTDGWTEELRLSNDPPHGIQITKIEGADRAVFFYSEKPVGMEHYDVFKYIVIYNSAENHPGIWVESFLPGRPEVMEHDNEWYVGKEQERLNAIGYNPY